MLGYTSEPVNDSVYDDKDINKINEKMEILLIKEKRKPTRLMPPGIKVLLEEYGLLDLFKVSDFKGIRIRDGTLNLEQESLVNERIINLMTEKIVAEKENRVQTEIQIEKFAIQNQKQISVLRSIFQKHISL